MRLVTELRAGLDQARAEVTELRMEIAAGAIALEQAEAAARAAEERAERLEAARCRAARAGALGAAQGGVAR